MCPRVSRIVLPGTNKRKPHVSKASRISISTPKAAVASLKTASQPLMPLRVPSAHRLEAVVEARPAVAPAASEVGEDHLSKPSPSGRGRREAAGEGTGSAKSRDHHCFFGLRPVGLALRALSRKGEGYLSANVNSPLPAATD